MHILRLQERETSREQYLREYRQIAANRMPMFDQYLTGKYMRSFHRSRELSIADISLTTDQTQRRNCGRSRVEGRIYFKQNQ
jgi:hypothetical protein